MSHTPTLLLDSLSDRPYAAGDLLDICYDSLQNREMTPADRYRWVTSTPELDPVRLMMAGRDLASLREFDPAKHATVHDAQQLEFQRLPEPRMSDMANRSDVAGFVRRYKFEASVRGAIARGFDSIPDAGSDGEEFGPVVSSDHAGICAAALVAGAVGDRFDVEATVAGVERSLASWRQAATGTAAWAFDACDRFDRQDSTCGAVLAWFETQPAAALPVLLPSGAALVRNKHLDEYRLPPPISVPANHVIAGNEDRELVVAALAEPHLALDLGLSPDAVDVVPTVFEFDYALAVARLSQRPDVVLAVREPAVATTPEAAQARDVLFSLGRAAAQVCGVAAL